MRDRIDQGRKLDGRREGKGRGGEVAKARGRRQGHMQQGGGPKGIAYELETSEGRT